MSLYFCKYLFIYLSIYYRYNELLIHKYYIIFEKQWYFTIYAKFTLIFSQKGQINKYFKIHWPWNIETGFSVWDNFLFYFLHVSGTMFVCLFNKKYLKIIKDFDMHSTYFFFFILILGTFYQSYVFDVGLPKISV